MSSDKTLGEAFDMVPPVTVDGEQTTFDRLRRVGSKPEMASRDDWRTPCEFVDGLRQRWRFAVDAACDSQNSVAMFGITAAQDALCVDWWDRAAMMQLPEAPEAAGRPAAVWCNPPYGRRGQLSRAFVGRAAQQARDVCGPAGVDVVLLLAATPDVRWFHAAIVGDLACDEIWFTKGRLAFTDPRTGKPATGNVTGSVLLVWRAGWTPRQGAPFLGSIGKDGVPTGAGGW